MARCAQLLLGQFYLCRDARRGFFKRKRHVVTQIPAALRTGTATPATTAEKILEAEKIAENIVEVLKNRSVKIYAAANVAQSGVAVGVVNLAFFLIAKHAVSFRALAEFRLGFLFIL